MPSWYIISMIYWYAKQLLEFYFYWIIHTENQRLMFAGSGFDTTILVMASPSPDVLGCSHYKRKCKLVAPCCDTAYNCRSSHYRCQRMLILTVQVLSRRGWGSYSGAEECEGGGVSGVSPQTGRWCSVPGHWLSDGVRSCIFLFCVQTVSKIGNNNQLNFYNKGLMMKPKDSSTATVVESAGMCIV